MRTNPNLILNTGQQLTAKMPEALLRRAVALSDANDGAVTVKLSGANVILPTLSQDILVGDTVWILLQGTHDAIVVGTNTVTTTPWTDVTFQNSWFTNTDVALNHPVQYRKDGDMVNLRGNIRRNAIVGTQTMFTLPAGFRPIKDLTFACGSFRMGTASQRTTGVRIEDGGQVKNLESTTSATTNWIDLTGISFPHK